MNLNLKKVLSLVITLTLFTVPVSISCFAGPREFQKIAEPALSKYEKLFRTEPPRKEYTELLFPDDSTRKKFIGLYNRMIDDCGFRGPKKGYGSTLYIDDLKTAGYHIWRNDRYFNCEVNYEDFLHALAWFNKKYLITLLYEDRLVFPSDNCRDRFFEIYGKVAKRNMTQVKGATCIMSLIGLFSHFEKYDEWSDGLTKGDYFFLFSLGRFNGLDLNFDYKLFSKCLCNELDLKFDHKLLSSYLCVDCSKK